MVSYYVEQLISSALEALKAGSALPDFSIERVPVERSSVEEHGDIATSVAMIIAKEIDKNPKEIAQILAEKLSENDNVMLANVAGPGFVNISFTYSFWQNELVKILEAKERYGSSKENNGSASVEFISVNPTGELHVAHGRGAFYGDALSRVLEASGYDVLREYYVNASHHNTQIEELGKAIKGEGDQYKGELIDVLKKKIDTSGDAMEVGFLAAQAIQNKNQEFIINVLGIPFKEWVWEESLYEDGLVDKARVDLEKKNVLQEKDGAKWFVPEGESIDNEDAGWVVIRSNGSPSYLLPDIAYHRMKNERGHERIIDILGADHQGHKEKLYAIGELFGFREKFQVMITQMVHLLEGGEKKKMSKRAGTAVPLAWLVKETGIDAVRFLFLMKSINTHMEFDIAKAKEKSSKNPVYYVQYAHTRCASVLRKADSMGLAPGASVEILTNKEELLLIKKLSQLPEVIDDSARDGEVHRIPHYLIALADVFHKFYHKEQVIGDNKEETSARLILIQATKQVFANGLSLLGVSAPDRM